MKRSLVVLAAAGVLVLVLAVALVGLRSSQGGSGSTAFGADIPFSIVIDADAQNGTGPCAPVDATATKTPGDVNKVAVCAYNVPAALGALSIGVTYNHLLNECPDISCPEGTCLDDNPDANAAVLGGGWDCNILDLAEPTCKKDATDEAWMSCWSLTGPYSSPVGSQTPFSLAVVTFNVMATGDDTLGLKDTALSNSGGVEIGSCDSATIPCTGAVVHKIPPPPQCDIADHGMVAAPAALSMLVGEHGSVMLTETIVNEGADPGRTAASCVVSMGWKVVDAATMTDVDPAKLGVRFEPLGCSLANRYSGDSCVAGNPSGAYWPDYHCPPPTGGWCSIDCDEVDKTSPATCQIVNSCQDAIDQGPNTGLCDWDGFSADCAGATGPDPNCTDITGILLHPLSWAIPGNTQNYANKDGTPLVNTRQLKVNCIKTGNYKLLVLGAHSVTTSPPLPAPQSAYDPDLTNDKSPAYVDVVCRGREAAMEKDANLSEPGVQSTANLWLMAGGCVVPEEGKGCLAIDVWLRNAGDVDDPNDGDDDPEGLGAWEHQVRFDHKIIKFENDLLPLVDCDGDTTLDAPWIECEGRIANPIDPITGQGCYVSVLTENWILEGCVTKDDPEVDGMQLGPLGDGLIETMLVLPQFNDLIYRSDFRPTKDNGVVTDIVDDNCEITDIYAEPMTGLLPGGLTPICSDVHITVRMLQGDINLDCTVDVLDDQALAFRYGASWGMQLYDSWYDLEPKIADQDIDIKDLQFVFGRNYSTCQVPIPDDQATPVPAPPF